MANAKAHTAIFFAAMGIDALDAIVTTRAAAFFDFYFARRKV